MLFFLSSNLEFNSAVISDCSSNSLRVIKTVKQTSKTKMSYSEIIKNIIKKDGVMDLFGRGLKTRIITNGIQGILFTVCWKYIEESYNMAKDNGMQFIVNYSGRWNNEEDPYKPTNPEFST